MLGSLTRVGALHLLVWQQHVLTTFGLGCRFLKIFSLVCYERVSAVHLSCFRVTTRSIYPLYKSLLKGDTVQDPLAYIPTVFCTYNLVLPA